MKECKNFVFKFTVIIIIVITINLITFNIFQNKVIFNIAKTRNEKNYNIVDKYIEENKFLIYRNSNKILNNIKDKLSEKDITEEKIINSVIEESNTNINYYIEIYDKTGKIIANSPGYIEKIKVLEKAVNILNNRTAETSEYFSGENNIYIKSFIKFKINNNNYISVISYKVNENFLDKVKEFINGDVNIYNKNMEITLTTLKGKKEEKIKIKQKEIRSFNRKDQLLYSNNEYSGLLKKTVYENIYCEVLTSLNTEKNLMKKYFYLVLIIQIIFFIVIITLLFIFIKNITGTDRDFWKKIKQCMLGNENESKNSEYESQDYRKILNNGSEIFIKNIYDVIRCLEKKENKDEKLHKFKDLMEIYNSCFYGIKKYNIEDTEIISTIKKVEELCSRYNIIIDIRKNRTKMYSIIEKNSVIYIFVSIIYKLSELYNSIKINIVIEDYGRKIFIRFKPEETGIKTDYDKCLEAMFNKEFIDYLLMLNNLTLAEKNGVVEISMNA